MHDYREATTADLSHEMSSMAVNKSGYDRLFADVVADRLYVMDDLERFIKDKDLHIDDQYTSNEVYAKLRDGATLGDIADMISDFSGFYIGLKLIVNQTDPREVKNRVRTKYEMAADANQ